MRADPAILTIHGGAYGSLTVDLLCPVTGEYEVTTISDECLDRDSERFDPHRTTDTTVVMNYAQGMLHFHAELQSEQSLSIQVQDAQVFYKVILMSPREGNEEEFYRCENVEVQYIPYEDEEKEQL